MAEASPIRNPRSCKGCGVEIRKQKFCTADCRVGWYRRTSVQRERARSRARGVRPVEEVRAERRQAAMLTCPHCGSSFKRNNWSRSSTYCSKRCARLAAAPHPNVSRDRRVYRRWAKAKTRGYATKIAALKRQAEKARHAQSGCVTCSTPVGYNGMGRKRLYCSEQCRPDPSLTEAGRASRRAAKARRRAVERGIEAERFDPLEVLARDGWRCHLCGVSTPKRLRGTYDDRAPELDHIVPLAAGGKHTRMNTACACRKCNITKGAEPRGQLRLVA